MGRSMEVVTGLAVAPGAVPIAASALIGNSLTVRDGRRDIKMVARWDSRQVVGISRITSPLLHDSSIGMQRGAQIGISVDRMTIPQRVKAQDSLSLQLSGSAVAGDIEHSSFLLVYEDLPGISARFITASELARRAVNRFDNTVNVTTGTTGQYTGAVAVSAAQDSFKANTDYALIGYDVAGVASHCVRISGPDWGNLGVGGPGVLSNDIGVTSEWFIGLDVIPVMSSANRSLTFLDCATNENAGLHRITLHWVELS